ncbi:hypothetical protein FIV42_21200 [Persicimonas caeni]|uniref:Pyrrolo-quinoline quinone repeat domain-containing protein n=1 Tax=Persicimonas caeni TaxID=2292766 RepID=A0A4Y6PXV5_PERCE|nr:PLuB system PQQ-binding repeat protein [Persicimonas caeni]QDG53168.1 hypothetical protein FIV42_21200 [Persicimonas caeni]QED34390.1 PQQ-binding-like beta-propeller repeat protein [Persicimonas caeni]
MRMVPQQAAKLALVLLALSVWSGCDKGESAEKAPEVDKPEVTTHAWQPPEAVDLTNPGSHSIEELALSEARKFPDCHQIFEPDGTPAESFPLSDDEQRPLELAGCEPEAYRVLDDGTRLVAYATPPDGPGWDMRLVSYAPSGELNWHYRLDRSENAKNFTANFRGSFIAPILPRLVCAGTLWSGGTEAACVDAESGEAKWDGIMKFWAGMAPQPAANALNSATLSGLTRRYPYSGVEMRYRPFDNRGGRAAFYATDGERLFFVPAQQDEADAIQMTAFDLESYEPIWRLGLEARPRATWTHAFGELGVVLFKVDEAIYAAKADTGELLWSATVGDDEPPVAARGGKLYLLLRRKADPNLLYELEPQSGQVNWYGEVPTGTLELRSYEDTLILRSVRAVQKVSGLE